MIDLNLITLVLLNEENYKDVLKIRREDISCEYVDSFETIMDYTRYGNLNGCIGHTYAVKLTEPN